MRKTQTFRLTAMSAALMTAFGAVWAAEDDIAQLTKPESSMSIGIGNWSSDRPQQGIYDGMREGRAYIDADINIVKRDDETGTWFTLDGRNLGLDTREFRIDYLRQGDSGFFFENSTTVRENPFKFNTGLQGIGSNTLVVSGDPDGTVFPFKEYRLGTDREMTQFGMYKNFLPGLDLNVSFKNEDKTGTRQWGRGGQPEFAVEPINSTTRQVEAVLSYTAEKLQLSGGYYGSWYDNSHDLVTTTRTTKNGAAAAATDTIYLSLPLDNQAHQLFLDGGYSFTPTTRGTFKVAYTRATQDEHLPTTDITGLSLAGAPTNLDGRIDTTLVQVGMTSRPVSDLSLLASARYYDVDDKTPVQRFVQTGTTNLTTVSNTPHSVETLSGKLEATYRLPMQMSVTGGVDASKQDRSVPFGRTETLAGLGDRDDERYVPFRAELDETTYRLQLRRAMSERVNGSVAYLHSKRDGSDMTLTNEAESDEINPIHIADRKRDKVRVSVDWTPLDALSLQFTAEKSDDEYGTSPTRPFGLQDGSAKFYSVDANYALNDRWQISAWYAHDDTKATQTGQRAGSGTLAAAEKEAHLRDVGDSVGLGIRGQVVSKLKFGGDLQLTRNRSEYPETLTLLDGNPAVPTSGTATLDPSLPEIENKLIKLALFAEYAVAKNADIRFDFIHERWTTDDWSWQFSDGSAFTYAGCATGGTCAAANFTDGTVVTADHKQVANFVGLRYNYRFQ